MTEEEVIRVYLDFIERNFPRLSIAKIADTLDLTESQVEQIIDGMSWHHFKIAQDVKKATAEDTVCKIIPFRGKIQP